MQVLQKQMDYYSHNPNADRIVQVQGEIDEVKKVMVENIGVCACVCVCVCVCARGRACVSVRAYISLLPSS